MLIQHALKLLSNEYQPDIGRLVSSAVAGITTVHAAAEIASVVCQ